MLDDTMQSEPGRAGHSVRGLANWILDFADSVGARHTNMGLNKLIYFAVEAILFEQRRVLTNAKIEAWEHGPVFREIYNSFKSFGDQVISGRASFYSTTSGNLEEVRLNLTGSEESDLRRVLTPLIHKNASELRRLSHNEGTAWYDVWWYDGHANPGMEITPELILGANPRSTACEK